MILLGVDWGQRRIGLAVSWSGELASPLRIVQAQSSVDETLELIAEVVRELEAEKIVLGVPAGSRHDAAAIHERFAAIAESLRQKTCKPVVLWDESYSTTEALALRNQAPRRRRRSQTPIDSAAAAVILQSFIDAEPRKDPSH